MYWTPFNKGLSEQKIFASYAARASLGSPSTGPPPNHGLQIGPYTDADELTMNGDHNGSNKSNPTSIGAGPSSSLISYYLLQPLSPMEEVIKHGFVPTQAYLPNYQIKLLREYAQEENKKTVVPSNIPPQSYDRKLRVLEHLSEEQKVDLHALQFYQIRLMVLEQQNKERLLQARKEQDNPRTKRSHEDHSIDSANRKVIKNG